jgi:hypothetical protein
MKQTTAEIKQRYFDKVYANAATIQCACGCGQELKDKDRYGRSQSFITGHNGRKYEDPRQHKREWNHRNREARCESKMERGRRLKARVVMLMGGKCDQCKLAYDGKNACVFELHHIDRSKKRFCVNARTLITYGWAKILEELKNCQLLCANCHHIIENEEY